MDILRPPKYFSHREGSPEADGQRETGFSRKMGTGVFAPVIQAEG